MKTYEQLGRTKGSEKIPEASANTPTKPGEKMIRVNGFQQVLEMLQAADEPFRQSLLNRIRQKNPELATSLMKVLYKGSR